MRRAALVLLLAAVAAVGVDVLGDRTQNRPDLLVPDSRSEIVLDVSTKDPGGTQEAAESLWAVCQTTVSNRLASPAVALGGGRVLFVTQPSMGRYGWRRLKGCLEDFSVGRTRAKVVAKHDLPAIRP